MTTSESVMTATQNSGFVPPSQERVCRGEYCSQSSLKTTRIRRPGTKRNDPAPTALVICASPKTATVTDLSLTRTWFLVPSDVDTSAWNETTWEPSWKLGAVFAVKSTSCDSPGLSVNFLKDWSAVTVIESVDVAPSESTTIGVSLVFFTRATTTPGC